MDIRVLGPLEASVGGRPVALGGGKPRALLAMLALNAGSTVPAHRLVEGLWGEEPPATAAKMLQVYVSQLRKALAAAGGGEEIATRGRGYELRLADDGLDVWRAERLLAEGAPREALALWRGPALADVADEPFATSEARRLEELRLDIDLAGGRHREVIGELETLVDEHPLRERLHAQRMLALYRAGRQADALEAYREARRGLVDEIGIEPGPQLRELHEAILRQDAALTVERTPRVTEARETDPPAPAQPTPAFVGRERELAALRSGLDSAFASRTTLILVGGQAGIGKSRLADELATDAAQRGAKVLWGRCWEAGGAPAYWPWVQSLRSLLRESPVEAIRRDAGAGAPYLAQILPELRELIPDLRAAPALDHEGARFHLFDATASFLSSASRREPLVIVLDDLHAADEPSLLLLVFLAQQLTEASVLVVGNYRDSELGPEHSLSAALTELARHAPAPILLTGLGEAEVARFVGAAHGDRPLGELAAAIHRQTEGNPLFVSEILRLLAAEGRLDGAAEGPGARVGIPPSVRAVIRRRLDHLSDPCTRLLTIASVLGREFDVEALARAEKQDLDPLLDLLDEAIAAGVVGEVPGTHGRLRFVHVLIRDTLYDELTVTRRMRLHRRIGEAFEALYGGDPDPHLAELALHFYEALPAGDAGKTVHYARGAADRAAALLAYEEAARLYAIAIEVIESHSTGDRNERCELLLALGDVQGRSGDVARAKETFLRAADVARGAQLPEHLARAALGYGGRFVWTRAWGDKHLVGLLEEAVRALPVQDSELRVRLLARLAGGPLRDTLPPADREAMSQQALDMARRVGDEATLAYALDGRHCANMGPDSLHLRLALADELIASADRVGDAERAYEGHDYRFHALLEAGELPRARREYEALGRQAQELRQPAQLWFAAVNGAKLALFEGRFADAEHGIEKAVEVGRMAQGANAQMAFDLQVYGLRREQGRLDEVLDVVQRAVDDYAAYPVWRYVLADVLAQLGRDEQAARLFAALADEGFPLYLEMQWLFGLSLAADVCAGLGDEDAAAVLYDLLRPYAAHNATLPPELCWGSVSRSLGSLAATMSHWDAASGHFEDALRANRAMGALPWLAHTHHDYARMLLARDEPGDRDRADELLAAADALATELGMGALAQRISARRG
jgi:DNA-binding SARP family transcriptional activator/tetratricopeptide (TPR) repeat protein